MDERRPDHWEFPDPDASRCHCGQLAYHGFWCRAHAPKCRSGAHFYGNDYGYVQWAIDRRLPWWANVPGVADKPVRTLKEGKRFVERHTRPKAWRSVRN